MNSLFEGAFSLVKLLVTHESFESHQSFQLVKVTSRVIISSDSSIHYLMAAISSFLPSGVVVFGVAVVGFN